MEPRALHRPSTRSWDHCEVPLPIAAIFSGDEDELK
jgi:hypothetical protein